jgi:IS5 family transposase
MWPHFCGEVVFRHEAPFDRSSLTRRRQRLGEEQIAALLQESLSVAHRTGAIEKLVERAKREGVELRQSYLRVAKRAPL